MCDTKGNVTFDSSWCSSICKYSERNESWVTGQVDSDRKCMLQIR